jgi:3-phenylpropionate/trans-cinnamate dioxygenase ferredoxin subunit
MRVKLGKADFAEREMRGYEVGNKAIVVGKLAGRYKALDDWCNHAGCLLSGGRVEGNCVVCPCHEVAFDFDTGINVTSPGVCDDQKAFQVTVEDGELFVEGLEPDAP